MTLRLGTRALAGFRNEHPAAASYGRTMSQDVGMSKNVTAALTFTSGNARVTGANGTFAAFVAGDPILIEGTNLNNGERIVTGIDAANHAYLVLDFAPQAEGPLTATVRTP